MAYSFTAASSQYMYAGLALSYPFTMACWFQSTSIATSYNLIGAGNASGSDNDAVYLIAAGATAGDPIQIGAITNGGTLNTGATTTGYSANTWTHACAVCTSATSRTVYKDGGSSATSTVSRAITGLDRIVIGARWLTGAASGFLNGKLAEVAFWNASLTAPEVAALAAGFCPRKIRPASLVFFAPIIRDLVDMKGGLTITTSGSPAVDNHCRIYR